MTLDHTRYACHRNDETTWPLLLCLLGPFRLLENNIPLNVQGDSCAARLLCTLALGAPYGVTRETLLESLWHDRPTELSSQSLHSLIYKLSRHRQSDAPDVPVVINDQSVYRLGPSVGVDVVCFDTLFQEGDNLSRCGDRAGAARCYEHGVSLYRSDLTDSATDMHATVERARLRGRFLTLLARLAEYRFDAGDYDACLAYAQRLLTHDACREDAHRLVMRCYAQQGQRAQALRQYDLCVATLRAELHVRPEPATTALVKELRRNSNRLEAVRRHAIS